MNSLLQKCYVVVFLFAVSSSLLVSGFRQLHSVIRRSSSEYVNIHRIVIGTGIYATSDDAEKTGYFKLPPMPQSSSDFPTPFGSESYADADEMPEGLIVDDKTKKRLLRQLMFAFDNYQEPEIIEMNRKILKMPSQLSKLLKLTTIAEEIEAAAEEGGGFDEYLYDALRSTRSQIRMYGKDVEFYDDDGKNIERTFWPWVKR